ncbi:MAG: hypothetical protein BMS9Abin29_1220 [Gemmatimonadota bacterium]|nr:MAG: hypothetical protein BMS9Abin29_1220 [Gemmatimonadota bacterium]
MSAIERQTSRLRSTFSPVRSNTTLTFTLLTALTACTSAADHFEAGASLEARGEVVRAAERYIDALEKDGSLVEARERLEELAPQVLALYLDRMEGAREREEFVLAADMLPDLDDFIEGARDVGVTADPGPDYRGLRRTVHDEAIRQLFGAAATDRRDGRFSEALDGLERIALYEPRSDDERAVRREAIDTRMSWARHELDQGRLQASFLQAGFAITIAGGPQTTDARAAVLLQEQALERGTVRLVGFPFEVGEDAAELSPGALTALHDRLLLEVWRQPPPFVFVIDPAVARAAIRGGRYDEGGITTREAIRIGRTIDTDFVALGDIRSFSIAESDVKSTPETARDRDGRTVTYHRITGRLSLDLRVALTLVEVGRGRVVETSSFRVSRSGNFERASYNGDPADLRLSRSVRNLFAAGRMASLRKDLEDRIVEEAARRFGQRAFREVLSRIP